MAFSCGNFHLRIIAVLTEPHSASVSAGGSIISPLLNQLPSAFRVKPGAHYKQLLGVNILVADDKSASLAIYS